MNLRNPIKWKPPILILFSESNVDLFLGDR
jgi:hypothetical protein